MLPNIRQLMAFSNEMVFEFIEIGTLGVTQTRDPLFRKQLLYSAELRGRYLIISPFHKKSLNFR